MRRRGLSRLVLVLLALSAAPGFADVSVPAGHENGELVILDAKQARACFHRSAGFFTPSAQEVRRLERLLPSAISDFAAHDPSPVMRSFAKLVLAHVAADRRIWFGRVDESRHWIDVYGQCARLAAPGNICPPAQLDGPKDCLWYVSFDVERRRFVRFDVNGVGTIGGVEEPVE